MSISESPSSDQLIGYFPNYEKYLQRRERILLKRNLDGKQILPIGFPKQLSSRMTWSSKSLDPDEWLVHLNSLHIQELAEALVHFQGLHLPLGLISSETFPLPELGQLLRKNVAEEVYRGRGFVVLRGVPVHKYDRIENAIIHAGICAWLGRLRGRQDPVANVVFRYIKDLGSQKAAGTAQYTADAQPYHTDWGDVIALYCLSTPAEGGASHLASVEKIYNILAETRPDIIDVLARNWAFDNFGAQPPYIERPLLFWHEEHLIIQYSRRLFTGFQTYNKRGPCPSLTEEQADAMDELEHLAQRVGLTMQLQKGDVQIINNMALLHGRDSYEDDKSHTRELSRIWLRNENLAWDMPGPLSAHWRRLFYESKAETQVFFPKEGGVHREEEGESQDIKNWTLAGNEGGIPES